MDAGDHGDPAETDAASQDTGYRFDPAEASLLVPLIDTAFANGAGYLDAHDHLGSAIKQLRGDPDETEDDSTLSIVDGTDPDAASAESEHPEPAVSEPIGHEIDRAMLYDLDVPFDGPVTCNLRDLGGWPPPIKAVTASVADLWEFLAGEVAPAGARARFHDLAYVHGRDRFAHALAARDAYIEFGRSRSIIDLDEGHALLRAWTIDRQLGRSIEEAEDREAMRTALAAAWDDGERAAGVLLPLLGALCRTDVPPAEDTVPVDALLERASKLYASTDSVTYIGELRRTRATSDEERREVSEWQVSMLAEIARQSEGLIKVVRLQEAIAEARRLHLDDMRDALTVELQAVPASEIKLERIRSDFPVSRIPLERYFRQFTRDHDWRAGMIAFAHTPPPTGSLDELKATMEKRRRRPLIADLFRPILLDEDRLPTWQPGSDEEHDDYLLARQASHAGAGSGLLLSEVLDRIHQRYGNIPTTEMTALLADEGRGNYELSAVAARALAHYWAGDLEACIHVAVPRIESAARLILKQCDIAIYRTQLGQRPGMYPQLSTLLDSLGELDFDDSWLYFLRWLLVNHSGKNMRNQIAHGRVRTASTTDAALVLRALILLVLLTGPGTADDIDDAEDLTPPARPAGEYGDLAAAIRLPSGTPVRYPSTAWFTADERVRKVFSLIRRLLGYFSRSRS